MTKILLSIGHGYVARALARILLEDGWRVIGTTRSAETAAEIARTGAEPLVWQGGALGDALQQADALLTSVAPDAEGTPVLRMARDQIADAAQHLTWAGYLSTTGVYGDRGGDWVDETSDLRPATNRGRARVAAEEAWRSISGLPLHIFRLPGIYGPGRSQLDRVRSGTARAIIKDGQVFSRIHVDDIAAVLAASIAHPVPGAIYNVADDEPAPPQDVLAYAAHLLHMDPPPEVPFDEADLSPMARSFYAESKRVRNDRIKSDLGVKLRYPSYREGLKAILEAETSED